MKHGLGMLLGCGLAFFLAFLLPALGVSGNLSLGIVLVLMIGCHLLMGFGGHGKDKNEEHKRQD